MSYGMFSGESYHSDNHRYRNVEDLISGAKHHKNEQEPERATKKMLAGALREFERRNIFEIVGQVKMAKEIPKEDWEKIQKGEMKHRRSDEIVTVKFTRDVDMEKTFDEIMMGNNKYDPNGKTVISEAGKQMIREKIMIAHELDLKRIDGQDVDKELKKLGKIDENGNLVLKMYVPMAYRHGADAYEQDEKTKEKIPVEIKNERKAEILEDFERGQFKPVPEKPNLYKHATKDLYIKRDANNLNKLYEANQDGSLKYKIRQYQVTIKLQYNVGLQIWDKDGKPITVEKDRNGNPVLNEKGEPIAKKLSGTADRNSHEWKDYVECMSRLNHVGEKYARDPKLEATYQFGKKAGQFAANEAFRTTVNMAIRMPIQATQEAHHKGDQQISQFLQMIMPAIKGQTR